MISVPTLSPKRLTGVERTAVVSKPLGHVRFAPVDSSLNDQFAPRVAGVARKLQPSISTGSPGGVFGQKSSRLSTPSPSSSVPAATQPVITPANSEAAKTTLRITYPPPG